MFNKSGEKNEDCDGSEFKSQLFITFNSPGDFSGTGF